MKNRMANAAVALCMLSLTACVTMFGGAVGAGSGAAIGAGTGYGAKKGALIGGGAGAAAGAVYDILR
jgi:osmotically inducible lipoprotein OsmB